MACGRIVRPLLTFGLFSCRSLNFRAFGDFGFDAAAFGVVRRSLVELDFDEEEEFGEVGSRPTGDGLCQSARNHCQTFTCENIR